jgi:hypothetical protein
MPEFFRRWPHQAAQPHRKAIQDVIPGITDADRYAVTAMSALPAEMFTSTRVLTVGAAMK